MNERAIKPMSTHGNTSVDFLNAPEATLATLGANVDERSMQELLEAVRILSLNESGLRHLGVKVQADPV